MIDVWPQIVGFVGLSFAVVAITFVSSRRGARRVATLDHARSVLQKGTTIAVVVESVTIRTVIEATLEREGLLTAAFPVTHAGFAEAIRTVPVAFVARQNEVEERGLTEFINQQQSPVVLLQFPFRRESGGSSYARPGLTCIPEPFDTVALIGALSTAVESAQQGRL